MIDADDLACNHIHLKRLTEGLLHCVHWRPKQTQDVVGLIGDDRWGFGARHWTASVCIAIIYGCEEGKIKYPTEALPQSHLFHPKSVVLIVERWTNSHGCSGQGDKHRHASGHEASGKPWRHRSVHATIPEFVLFFFSLPVLKSIQQRSKFLAASIIERLLFVVAMLFTVCYKCLWWKTELFLRLWLHKVVIPVWSTAHIREWRGAQVRVLENCSHVTELWLVNPLSGISQCLDLGSMALLKYEIPTTAACEHTLMPRKIKLYLH